ncbi:MAG: ABC transporter permease [Candidatus Sulfotelmatobacter sp.]
MQDLRFALRQLRKNKTFTAISVITLALAVGANTAIFSVVHAVLLGSLPYKHVDRLAMIWGRNASRGDLQFPISAGDFTDWKQKNDVFEDIAASYDDEVTLTGSGDPKIVLGYDITPNYFRILGTEPEIGRTFSNKEAESKTNVAVLSDKFWRNTFHGDPKILGRSITLDAKPYTIVGVMPPGFEYPPRTELWKPTLLDHPDNYGDRFVRVLGRLRPGISMAAAQVRMNALEAQIASQHSHEDAGNETWVEPLRHELVGGVREPLLVLFGAVSLVLLIACVNIASLFLARAGDRRVEVSVRVAMGATRFRLLRQFLCESMVLCFSGGALGLVFAVWCTRFLLSIFPNGIANLGIPKVESIPIDTPVLLFALGITILTGVIFGAVPALQSGKASASEALKELRTSSSSFRSSRARGFLVAAQIALAVILLAGGGLMIESFRHVYGQDLGFQPDPILALEVFLPRDRYPADQPEKQARFISETITRLQRVPGASAASATNYLPLSGFWGGTDFTVEGNRQPPGTPQPNADNRLVTPGYFSTMGIGLLRGRDFADADRSGAEHVAIINSTFARRFFRDADPMGKVLQLGDAAHPERWTIVGEVSDVRSFGPEQEVHAELYRPLAQASFPLIAFVVRTTGDPATLLKASEQAIWDVDKDQPIFDAMPMQVLAAQSITLRRTSTIVLAGFACLALLVAAVGLYGVVAYSVVQRTHEIGIRMALGAQRRDVLRRVLSQGMTLVLAGEIAGCVIALLVAQLASEVLYRVSPRDPWTFAIVVCGMGLVALIACFIPARRAMNLDPSVALRCE